MTPELHSLLLSWLGSGDAAQKAHAARRLAMPDAIGHEPPSYPPLASMATSVITTAVDFAASGFALASDEERGRRLAICRGCEHFDPERERCRSCGCYMNGKARIAAARCPLPQPKW